MLVAGQRGSQRPQTGVQTLGKRIFGVGRRNRGPRIFVKGRTSLQGNVSDCITEFLHRSIGFMIELVDWFYLQRFDFRSLKVVV